MKKEEIISIILIVILLIIFWSPIMGIFNKIYPQLNIFETSYIQITCNPKSILIINGVDQSEKCKTKGYLTARDLNNK